MSEARFQDAALTRPLLIIRGWRFRDLASFEKHADTIRHFFEPTSTVRTNVASLMKACRDEAEIVVGVHIRRGDYKDHMGGRYYFEHHQYVALMHQIIKLFPHKKLLFLICSNEFLPAEKFNGINFRFGNNHIAEDLYSFAECDYILGPPSTYTMWASFYGQVPLYKIFDPSVAPSLDAFSVADGNCDMPEDIKNCSIWGQSAPRRTLPQTLSGPGA